MKLSTTEEILQRREIRALLVVLFLRILYSAGMWLGTMTVGKSDWEKWITSILALIVLCSAGPFWLALRRRKGILIAGLVGLVLDLAVYGMLPIIWYNSVGGASVVPAYMVKHPNVMALGYMLLIFHSAAGRPLYPLLATIGVAAIQTGLLYFASLDPRTQFSSDFVAHMTAASISMEFWSANLFTFLAAGVSLSWIVRTGQRTLRNAVEKQMENDRLSRYFSPAVQEAILEQSADPFAQRGERKTVAVLFSDLRAFTSMSEKLEPEKAIAWLREYHQSMVEIIFRHGGTLDKFLGDGILAVFGAPTEGRDDAKRAYLAALEVQKSRVALNRKRQERGDPPFRQGIGLHFGPAIVGNIGVAERLEYTIIGDTVNVASRLQGMTKELGQDTLLSGDLVRELESGSVSLGLHTIRGREEPIEVFAPPKDA